jgi:plasmid stabilization system protein ParE
MSTYELLDTATISLKEIYRYTYDEWGEEQARRYIDGMFDCFERIANGSGRHLPIPAEYGVAGHFCRYEQHFIYWYDLPDGIVAIASILHARMDLASRLKQDFAP